MNKTITVLPGDGIGPEIIEQAIRVLKAIEKKYNHIFIYDFQDIGGAAYDTHGTHLPEETLSSALKTDAVLLGAIGGPVEDQDKPKWKDCEKNSLLGLRKTLELSINIRPVYLNPKLSHMSPLKKEIAEKGIDFVIIRELIGGIYFGVHETIGDTARDIMEYTRQQIAYPVEFACKAAMTRNKHVTLVDKANVLDTSRLWRKTAEKVCNEYKDIELAFMFVDNAAQQIIKNPSGFNVLVTSNMFGDILSDEASVLTGSLGLMPSASLGKNHAMYEPAHGSSPKYAGKNVANPIATILSAAMMLEYSFDMKDEAQNIRDSVDHAIEKGIGTKDIYPENPASTSEVTDAIVKYIERK